MQCGEAVLRKSGADSTNIDKTVVLLLVIHAEQQRSEPAPRAGRIGKAADHKLLATPALQLDPVAVTTRNIPAVRSLCDQTFQTLSAGRLQHGPALSANMVAVSQRTVFRDALQE